MIEGTTSQNKHNAISVFLKGSIVARSFSSSWAIIFSFLIQWVGLDGNSLFFFLFVLRTMGGMHCRDCFEVTLNYSISQASLIDTIILKQLI
jgi:hypothetical protein